MIKTYVIDTNVLIQAPYAIECFEENNLVLPLVVLEELEQIWIDSDFNLSHEELLQRLPELILQKSA